MRGRRVGLLHRQGARVVAAVDALRVAAAEKAKRNWPLGLFYANRSDDISHLLDNRSCQLFPTFFLLCSPSRLTDSLILILILSHPHSLFRSHLHYFVSFSLFAISFACHFVGYLYISVRLSVSFHFPR